MAGNVHQDDETKLKATVTQAEKDRTVTNDTYANLKGQVKVTDGTNFLPTMDAIARAAYIILTDGTDVVDISPAGRVYTSGQYEASIKTAVELIDNFISGNRGLVTEDNSADIKTAVEGVAHDAVDSGNPHKIGAKATDYTPDSGAEEGAASVAAGDRVNIAANLKGEQVECVKAQYTTLTDLNQTYDDDPTTDVSAEVTSHQYRTGAIGFEITVTGSPTLILIEVETSLDGTNFDKLMDDKIAYLAYSPASIGSGIKHAVPFKAIGQKLRARITCTGTDADNSFTVANCCLYLRN